MNNKNKIIVGIAFILVLVVCYLVFGTKDGIFKESKKEILIKDNSEVYREVEDDSIIYTQRYMDKNIVSGEELYKYNLDKPYVQLNPYSISPLTAIVAFRTDKETKITMTIKGKNNNDLKQVFEVSKDHYIPVYGLYPNFNNRVILEDDDGKTKEITIKTEDIVDKYMLNNSLLTMKIEENKTNNKEDLYFVSSPLSQNSYAYDVNGDLRWIIIGYYKELQRLENGNLLISSKPIENTVSYNSDLVEMDLLGKIYNYYKVENGFHNSYKLLDNNHVLIASNSSENNIGDLIKEIDLTTGEIVNTYNITKLLENIDSNFIRESEGEWAFNSGVDYDKDNNAIILSYWQSGVVISIDYKTKTLNWMFGNKEKWPESFHKYFLTLQDSTDYTYPLSVHSAKITNKNNLSIFDNGFDLNGSELCEQLKENISSIVDYKIDYSAKTISLVSRRLQDLKLFSYALGDYDKKYENELVLFGREMENVDYSQKDCNIFDHTDWSSYIVELNKDGIVFKAKLSDGFYRVSKFPLYVGKNNVSLSNGKIFKTSGKVLVSTDTVDLKDKIKNAVVNPENNFSIMISNNMVYANLSLLKEQYADIILVDKYGEGKIYNYKLKDIESPTEVVISGLLGKYYVYFDFDGTVYDLKQFMEF